MAWVDTLASFASQSLDLVAEAWKVKEQAEVEKEVAKSQAATSGTLQTIVAVVVGAVVFIAVYRRM